MEVKKIDKQVENYQQLLEIPLEEIKKLHKKIVESHRVFLETYGVVPVWRLPEIDVDHCTDEEFIEYLDAKELQLIFLYKHINCLVHKDVVSEFVRKFKPSAAYDQQVRHLGSQLYWNVLNKGNKIPDKEITVPSGYNYLVSIETPNPKLIAIVRKRSGRLSAKSFDELKMVYDYKCATCGIQEGKKDARNNLVVSLQQGHMNPRQPLDLSNTIPQCQYCNQQYLDYFCFNEYGRVIAVNNPLILLKSPKDVQDEMIEVLLKERKGK